MGDFEIRRGARNRVFSIGTGATHTFQLAPQRTQLIETGYVMPNWPKPDCEARASTSASRRPPIPSRPNIGSTNTEEMRAVRPSS